MLVVFEDFDFEKMEEICLWVDKIVWDLNIVYKLKVWYC